MACEERILCFSIFMVVHLWSVNGFLLEGHTNGNPIVKTTCGPVRGTGNSSDGVYVFKGIPYALPPSGHLRWKPPVPLSPSSNTCWKGIYDAFEFSAPCYQPNFGTFSAFHGSEDCLYLNVWTPTLDPNANLPVLLWIHGGFLLFASGNYPEYSPTVNLTRDTRVVYVSMNYRLNAFGFMALDILSDESPTRTSGNYGLRDQILAMQWVKDNIRQFGGDPNRVTVYGQSSGGTSIFALLASPMAKGLFQRAWLMSGSPVLNKTLADASRDNLVFLRKTNCSDVACLRQLTPLQVAQSIPWFEFPYWAMTDLADLPVKDVFDGALAVVDGVVLPKAPFDAWRDGEGNDVPTIIGTTAQETDFEPTPADLKNWTWSYYKNYVHKKLDTFGGNLTDRALELYPVSTQYNEEYAFTSMSSDLRVTCPNDVMAIEAARSFKSDVWRYVVTSSPSKAIHPLGSPFASRYAFHMWDYIAFSGFISYYIEKPSLRDIAFQNTMRREIMAFVRTGRVASYSYWTKFPPTTAVLDTGTTIFPAGYNPEKCDFWLKNGMFSYAWIN